jgi:methylthioribose-1-phosphate isomerase
VAARVPEDLDVALSLGAERLAAARPTAVNLAWAVGRMRAAIASSAGADAPERILLLEAEAGRIAEEDRLACLEIARLGAAWLRARWAGRTETPAILTHCNAGALATAGVGTALGVVRALAGEGSLAIFADETRPFLQGARLTAWELKEDGLDVTLLPDVAAASLIARGRVQGVVVGADRIAANGDVANKVGTYGLALACRAHGVPFVVAAPTTTVDLATATGASIPIEERDGREVLELPLPGGGTASLAPEGVGAIYPAFDVTPAVLVDAIVTERGVSEPPHGPSLARLVPR